MYLYEDRLRAVELCLKFGKRIKATIRQLGYPTKNSLKAWCNEFEKSGDRGSVQPRRLGAENFALTEGWQATRLLGTLLEHELAERAKRRTSTTRVLREEVGPTA